VVATKYSARFSAALSSPTVACGPALRSRHSKPSELITSIAESAPNPIRATLPADNPGTNRHHSLDNVQSHGEVLKPQGTMVQNDAAFRRDSDHDHLG